MCEFTDKMSLASLKDEVWKSHPIYHNHSASNFARVKNTKIKRLLTGHVDKEGYTQLQFLGYQKDSVRIALHIFVYECFNEIVDSKKYDIDHINNDKKLPSYNHITNLQKLTRKEHNAKAAQIRKTRDGGYTKKDDKYLIWRIKVNSKDEEVERIRYDSLEKLLEDGFSFRFVSKCCRGIIEKHRGYKWEFLDLPGEYWVSLYDEKYDKCLVSNMGRVNHNYSISYGYTGRSGYKIKSVNNTEYKVHHLICLAFHGRSPTSEHTPDHINNIVDDNRSDNLRWANKKQQTMNRTNYRKVCAFDAKTGIYFKTWDTQAEAAKELKIKSPSSISDVCSGKNKSSGGYIFQYTNNDEVKENIDPITKKIPAKQNFGKVVAYDLETGKIFKIFESQGAASKELKIYGSGISLACSGRYKTYGGYIWKYQNEI